MWVVRVEGVDREPQVVRLHSTPAHVSLLVEAVVLVMGEVQVLVGPVALVQLETSPLPTEQQEIQVQVVPEVLVDKEGTVLTRWSALLVPVLHQVATVVLLLSTLLVEVHQETVTVVLRLVEMVVQV